MKLFYYPSQILIHCFTWNTFNSIFIFFSFFSMFHVKLFFYWFTLPYPSKKSNFLIFKIFTFLYQKNFFDYSSDTYLLAVSRETYSPFLYKNYFTETLQIHFSNSSIQFYFLVFFIWMFHVKLSNLSILWLFYKNSFLFSCNIVSSQTIF